MLQKRTVVFFSLLLVCLLSALWAGFILPSYAQRRAWFAHFGFYCIFASFALWSVSLLRTAPGPTLCLQKLRQHWRPLLLALILCVCAFLTSPPKIRILFDEVNLIGAGQNLYIRHSPAVAKNAFFLHGVPREISATLGKRPLAFPFLLYVTHVLTGYSGYNGFILNFLAAFCALFVWYVLLRRWFPPWAAYAGMLLLAAYPLFITYATSSGFEIVNLLFILLSFHFFNVFIDQRTAEQAERLLLTLVILAQCRYESALFILVFVPFILRLLPKKEYGRLSPLTLAAPLLLLPVAWQGMAFSSPEFHDIHDGRAMFGVGYLLKNLKSALICMRGYESAFGMLSPVFFLACAGALWSVFRLMRKQISKNATTLYPLLVFLLSYLMVALLEFSYHLAILTAVTAARLGIIYLPVLIFFALIALRSLETEIRCHTPGTRFKQYIVLGCCLLLFFAWPVAGNNKGINQIMYYRRYDSVLHFLKRTYPEHNVLLIDERAHLYIAHKYSAVTTAFARANMPRLLQMLRQHFFQDILVLQNISFADNKPLQNFRLKTDAPLQTIYTEQIDTSGYLRISRVALTPKDTP